MGAKTLKQGYMSIGTVVDMLTKEWPDLTISKIRFLEDEGLIDPKRTRGGYRRFSEADVERLRMILLLQKERYLPLKVIKDELKKVSTGRLSAADVIGEAGAKVEAAQALEDTGKRMTVEEAVEVSGLTLKEIRDLEAYGLVSSEPGEKGIVYSPSNVKVMHLVRSLAKHGIEARHLKMYQSFAERESSLLTQIVMPILKQKSEEAKMEAVSTLSELAALSGELRQALLDNNLRDALD